MDPKANDFINQICKLVRENNANLKTISLDSQGITDEQLMLLADAFVQEVIIEKITMTIIHNAIIEKITIKVSKITDQGIIYFFQKLKDHPTIKYIDFSESKDKQPTTLRKVLDLVKENFTLENIILNPANFVLTQELNQYLERNRQYAVNRVLTSLLYELKRHPWEHHQCVSLTTKLKQNPYTSNKLKELADKCSEAELEKHLETQETQWGDFFGENISEDSDSDQEQLFGQKSSAIQANERGYADCYRRKAMIYGSNSLIDRVIELEKLKTDFYQKYLSLNSINSSFLNDGRKILEAKRTPGMKNMLSFGGRLLLKIREAIINEYSSGKDIARRKKALGEALKLLLRDQEFSSAVARCTTKEFSDAECDFRVQIKIIIKQFAEITYRLNVFDSQNFISQIPYENNPNFINSTATEDLNKLNMAIAQGKFREVLATVSTNFVIADYRGDTYVTSLWNHPSRYAHYKLNEIGKTQFAHGVFINAGIQLTQHHDLQRTLTVQEEVLLVKHGKRFRLLIREMKRSGPVLYFSGEERRAFRNLNDLLQHNYSNNYQGMQKLMRDIKDFLLTNGVPPKIANLLNDYNVFVSFGMAKHAAAYANGTKPYEGQEHLRLRPRWRKNGRAERPKTGKLYTVVCPIKELDFEAFNHVPQIINIGHIFAPSHITAEDEVSFYGFLEGKYVVNNYPVKYPSFHHAYKNIFLIRYGLTKDEFTSFQKGILNTRPHTIGNRLMKKILGKWLTRFQAIKMHNETLMHARQHKQVLVFMTKGGTFSFKPESPTIREGDETLKEIRATYENMGGLNTTSKITTLTKREFDEFMKNRSKDTNSYFSGAFRFDEQMGFESQDYDADDEKTPPICFTPIVATSSRQLERCSFSSNQQADLPSIVINAFEKFFMEQAKALSLLQESAAKLETELKNQAGIFGAQCKSVPGDGNCFFHAVVDQIKANNPDYKNTADDLKAKALQHIIDNIDAYAGFMGKSRDDFINEIMQNGAWVNHLLIQALSRTLLINIIIVRSDGAAPTIIKQKDAKITVYLGYEVGIHYQSLYQDPNLKPEKNINAYLEAAEIDTFMDNLPKLLPMQQQVNPSVPQPPAIAPSSLLSSTSHAVVALSSSGLKPRKIDFSKDVDKKDEEEPEEKLKEKEEVQPGLVGVGGYQPYSSNGHVGLIPPAQNLPFFNQQPPAIPPTPIPLSVTVVPSVVEPSPVVQQQNMQNM